MLQVKNRTALPAGILDVAGLSHILGLSVATVFTWRSRQPEMLPPPFLSKPPRWRAVAVEKWMEDQEKKALAQPAASRPSRRARARALAEFTTAKK